MALPEGVAVKIGVLVQSSSREIPMGLTSPIRDVHIF